MTTPTTSDKFKILPTERAILLGTTGSGKSKLASSLLVPCNNIVSIDPKGDFEIPGGLVITDPHEFSRIRKTERRPILYQPHPDFWRGGWYDAVFRWIYERQHTTCYIDELLGVLEGKMFAPEWLLAILTRGRSRNIRTIACSQRPFRIPMEILSESDHRFMFELDMENDKLRCAELMPGKTQIEEAGKLRLVPTVLLPLRNDHGFYYYSRKEKRPTRECLMTLRKAA